MICAPVAPGASSPSWIPASLLNVIFIYLSKYLHASIDWLVCFKQNASHRSECILYTHNETLRFKSLALWRRVRTWNSVRAGAAQVYCRDRRAWAKNARARSSERTHDGRRIIIIISQKHWHSLCDGSRQRRHFGWNGVKIRPVCFLMEIHILVYCTIILIIADGAAIMLNLVHLFSRILCWS